MARTKHAGGILDLYVNYSGAACTFKNGTLALGAPGDDETPDGSNHSTPFRTLDGAAGWLLDMVDFNGRSGNPTKAILNLADSVIERKGMHFSPHGLVGGQGGAAMKIKGGTNSDVIGDERPAFELYNAAWLQFEDVGIGSLVSHGISLQWGSKAYINAGCRLLDCAEAMILLDAGAKCRTQAPVRVDGTAKRCVMSADYASFSSTHDWSFLRAASFLAFAEAYTGKIAMSGQFINKHLVTGTRATAWEGGLIKGLGGGVDPNDYFPGTFPCTWGTGGVVI